MRGQDQTSGQLFSYVDLEERVPAKHPLRLIREIVNDVLASLSSDFESMYARMGRPSIPPEQLLHHDADGQSVSVFHQGMTHETQLALLAITLAVKAGLGIRRAFVSIVAPLLAVKIPLHITVSGTGVAIFIIFGAKAFHRCPGFNQCAVYRKMIPAQKATHL